MQVSVFIVNKGRPFRANYFFVQNERTCKLFESG